MFAGEGDGAGVGDVFAGEGDGAGVGVRGGGLALEAVAPETHSGPLLQFSQEAQPERENGSVGNGAHLRPVIVHRTLVDQRLRPPVQIVGRDEPLGFSTVVLCSTSFLGG